MDKWIVTKNSIKRWNSLDDSKKGQRVKNYKVASKKCLVFAPGATFCHYAIANKETGDMQK